MEPSELQVYIAEAIAKAAYHGRMPTASQETFSLGEAERTRCRAGKEPAEANALPHLSVGLHNTLARASPRAPSP